MANEINLENANWRAFTDFARGAASENTLAQVGAQGLLNAEGAMRTITASASGDKIGNLFRSGAQRTVNDEVRNLFKSTIIDLFDGERNIPENVLKAMKLEDFGSGKPLSARRIREVEMEVIKSAWVINARKESAAEALAKANIKPGVSAERRAEIQGRIDAAVRACGSDNDLLLLVRDPDVAKKLLEGGDGRLRTSENVVRRVADLRANVEELRTVAKGDAKIMDAGLKLLKNWKGAAVRPGILPAIVNAVKKADIGHILSLGASSSQHAIHKAVLQYDSLLDKILVATGALQGEGAIEGANDALRACHSFVLAVAMRGANQAKVRNMMSGLAGVNAGKLLALYTAVSNGVPEDFTGNKPGLIHRTKLAGYTLHDSMSYLLMDVARTIGEDDPVPPDEPDEYDAGYAQNGRMIEDCVQLAKTHMAALKEKFIAGAVDGDGPDAEFVKDLIDKRIGDDCAEPSEAMKAGYAKMVTAFLNSAIFDDMKKLAAGNMRETQFAKDITNPVMEVKLPGNVALSHDLDEACDQIARFVSNDPAATYKGLAGETRAKAHLVMSLISQNTDKAATTGIAYMLDPAGDKGVFEFAFRNAESLRKLEFSLDNGKLRLSYKCDWALSAIQQGLEPIGGDFPEPNPNRKLKTEFSFSLSAAEVSRIVNLDLGKMDEAASNEVFNRPGVVQDRLVKTQEALGEDFVVKPASCLPFFALTLP